MRRPSSNIQIHIAEMLFGFRLNTNNLLGFAWQFQPKQKKCKNINDMIMDIAYRYLQRKSKAVFLEFLSDFSREKAPNLLIASNTLYGL